MAVLRDSRDDSRHDSRHDRRRMSAQSGCALTVWPGLLLSGPASARPTHVGFEMRVDHLHLMYGAK